MGASDKLRRGQVKLAVLLAMLLAVACAPHTEETTTHCTDYEFFDGAHLDLIDDRWSVHSPPGALVLPAGLRMTWDEFVENYLVAP